MRTLEEIKILLLQYKQELIERFKVKEIGIFGSNVKGDQRPTSDIDLLVDFKEDADLFDFIGLGLFLEEELNQKVDVVPKRAIRKEFKDRVLKEVVYL